MKKFFIDLFKSNLYLAYGLLFIFFAYFIIGSGGMNFDMSCWKTWTIFGLENGWRNVYNCPTNDYLPLYHYFLSFYGKWAGSAENIVNNINKTRIVTLGFEFIAGIALLKLFYDKFEKNIYKAVAYSMFYFVNIAVFYNSVVWGQVDGIMTCFIFFSFLFAYNKKVLPSLIFIILALNFKPQAIIFIPLILLLLLPEIWKNFNFKNLFIWLFVPLLLQVLILLPFIESLDKIWQVAVNAVGKYPFISINAYNFWGFLKGGQCHLPDTSEFLNITYRNWGLLMFFISSFIALFPLLKKNYQIIFEKRQVEFLLKELLIGATLISLLFFFFNTQMHERYAYPALIFCIAYAVLYKKPLPLILLTTAYFLNMEYAMNRAWSGGNVTLIRPLCAILYFIDILLLYKDLYNIKIRRLYRKSIV